MTIKSRYTVPSKTMKPAATPRKPDVGVTRKAGIAVPTAKPKASFKGNVNKP